MWLPADADLSALELATDENGVEASIAETDKEGSGLSARTWADSARERGPVAAGLRRRWLRRLREEGLSSVEARERRCMTNRQRKQRRRRRNGGRRSTAMLASACSG